MSYMDKVRKHALTHAPLLFSIARAIAPVLRIRGTVFVFRDQDVRAVLEDEAGYGVTYGPKMLAITENENFFLGMDASDEYRTDVANMRAVMPPTDLETVIAPMIDALAREIVDTCAGDIDVPAQLGNRVPARFVARYMGIPGTSESHLVEWTNRLFQYLFLPSPYPFDEQLALRYGKEFADHIDTVITHRRDAAEAVDDSVGRCLALQDEGSARMDDHQIRNNLMGIIIGCIPTTSKCVTLVMDYLLDHPDQLAGAQAAARDGDLPLLRQYMLESIRLNVFSPAVTRISRRDQQLRGRDVRKGDRVVALVRSAMLDPRAVPAPAEFRLDRPLATYLHWGHGMHTCFGAQLNLIQIPLILQALLRRSGLERAPDVEGSMTLDGFIPSQMRIYYGAE